MAVRYSTGTLNKLLGSQDLRAQFTNCVIDIYSGAQPVDADSAVTGTKLAQVTLAGGAFTEGSPTNGLNFDAPVGKVLSKAVAETWQYAGLAAGTAGWFRLRGNAVDSGAASTTLPRIDGSISGATGSGDMKLSNLTVAVGSPGTIDTFTITLS